MERILSQIAAMTSLPWPTILTVLPALLIGFIIGWLVQRTRYRPLRLSHDMKQKREKLHQIRNDISNLNRDLLEQNQLLTRTQQHLETQEQEYNRLLVLLDEKQAAIADARQQLQSTQQDLDQRRQKTGDLQSDVHQHLEELETLEQLHKNFDDTIKRLTQQMQWKNSEIRRLRQMSKVKKAEIDEAEQLIERYDADLKRLHQQRRQREIDLANARQVLQEKDENLVKLMNNQASPAMNKMIVIDAPGFREDVTPPPPPETVQSPALTAPAKPAARWGDDLGIDIKNPREDGFVEIPGIGDYFVRQLHAEGITSYWQLARSTVDEIKSLLEIPGHYSPNIGEWINEARKLVLEQHYGADEVP